MSTYSSHFFVNSPVAFGQNKTKATVGLGFDLPVDILAATTRAAPMVGLGIFADLSDFDSVETESVASPPMLASRRSPRRPQLVDTPGTESAPMQTPSPSLRGGTSDAPLFAPSAPSLGHRPAFSRAASDVGLGIDLQGLDASELALSCREQPSHAAAYGVGLGLSLPCLQETELITTIEPLSTSQTELADDLSFLEGDIVTSDSAAKNVGLGLSLPCLQDAELTTTLEPLSTSQKGMAVDLSFLENDVYAPDAFVHVSVPASPVDVREIYANPKPSRANLELGFDLYAVAEAVDANSRPLAHVSPIQRSPSLGFGSPFWAMYASALQGV